MRGYPLVNFASFNTIELCDFIAQRVYADVEDRLDRLQQSFDRYPTAFESEDEEHLLPILFLQLADQCRQLLRLETLALFPHMRNQAQAGLTPSISSNTAHQLAQAQKIMLSQTWRLGLTLNFYVSPRAYNTEEQILVNDLHLLSCLLQDWVVLVQHHLVARTENASFE